jgi:hypothetical protein
MTMQAVVSPFVILMLPFFFILLIVGVITVAKRIRLGFRIRNLFARIFLSLERSDLFEREDEEEKMTA